MTDNDLELAALLQGLDCLWRRAGLSLSNDLFSLPPLSADDKARLKLAARLAGDLTCSDKPLALRSLFERVALEHGSGQAGYLPVTPMHVTEPQPALYPTESAPAADDLRAAYRKLCEQISTAAVQQSPMWDDPAARLESIYLLLARFTTNIPVSAAAPDIALFDYNHMIAAIATCLRASDADTVARWLALPSDRLFEQTDAIGALLGGDIAGVQDFIYSLQTHGKAARSLRGRSFYLQTLTEAAMRYVLHRLDLPVTAVIYSGGAHFFLLVPAEHPIDDLRRELVDVMLTHHQRDLYLVLASAPVHLNDFYEGAMASRWTALHSNLAAVKRQRYTEVAVESRYDRVFAPLPVQTDFSAADRWFADLGASLAHASQMLYGVQADCAGDNAIEQLGLRFALPTKADDIIFDQFDDGQYRVRFALTDDAGPAPNGYVDGVRYTVNLVPKDTFDELAARPTFVNGTPRGIQRLGVLRMDVDNLGQVFARGLGEAASLTRLAGLSRIMATFFEGRVAQLCRQIQTEYDPDHDSIYAVYAGGDDVFLVGPWHLMPPLARLIRTEFDRLTLTHPNLHISAGISLVPAKYPLYQAADDAGEALDAAKGRPGKNAISFLGEVLPWNAPEGADFAHVEMWAQRFIDLGQQYGNRFPMSLLGRLMQLDAMRRDAIKREPNAKWGRWIWTGVYNLYRLREQYQRNRSEQDIADLIGDTLAELQKGHFTNLPTLAFAARWAHLTLRRSRDERDA